MLHIDPHASLGAENGMAFNVTYYDVLMQPMDQFGNGTYLLYISYIFGLTSMHQLSASLITFFTESLEDCLGVVLAST